MTVRGTGQENWQREDLDLTGRAGGRVLYRSDGGGLLVRSPSCWRSTSRSDARHMPIAGREVSCDVVPHG